MKKILLLSILLLVFNCCFSQNESSTLHDKYMQDDDYCKKMAEKGDAVAQNALGTKLDLIFANYVEALKWYNKSAAQGNAMACLGIADCYYYGNGVTANNQIAANWYKKAIERQGCWALDIAFRGLAYCYFGVSPIQNYAEAYKWFKKATIENTEDYESKYRIAWMLEYGKGVEKNLYEAAKLYISCADKRTDAALGAASCYYFGLGVAQNYSEAVKLWKKIILVYYEKAQMAKEIGLDDGGEKEDTADALYYLAECYTQGHGVSKDQNLADMIKKYWSEKDYINAIWWIIVEDAKTNARKDLEQFFK